MRMHGNLDLRDNQLQNAIIETVDLVTNVSNIAGVAGQLLYLSATKHLYLCQQTNPVIWLNISTELSTVHSQTVAATSWNIAHTLGTTNVIVQVYDAAGLAIIPDAIQVVDANNITVSLTTAITGKAVIVSLDGTSTAGGAGGASALVDLTDTTITTPATGEVLSYDGTNWVNTIASVAGLNAFKAFDAVASTLLMDTVNHVFVFDSVAFDTAAAYNSTTGRFQPTTAGYYQINTHLGVYTPVVQTNAYFSISLAKNGVEISLDHSYINTANNGGAGVSDVFYLNGTTDYIEVFYEGNVTGGVTSVVGQGNNYSQCTFSAHLVGGSSSGSSTLVDLTDTTITTPASGEVLSYDGTNWVNTTASVAGGGKILQVIQNHVTTMSSQALTPTVRANIVGLNATITPSSTTSRIRVTVRWSGEGSNINNQDTVFGIRRGNIDVGNPAIVGSRATGISVISQGYWGGSADSSPDSAIYEYIDSPNSTSAINYKATILAAHAQTLYNNRTVVDIDSIYVERITSTITLEEIGA